MKKLLISCCFTVLAIFSYNAAEAQSLKNMSKVVGAIAGHFTDLDLTGTWSYSGSSVAFESDNLLKRAGGSLAASRIESSVDEQLYKIGFQPGITTFTFREDGTFTNILNGRSLSGTYTYDSDNGYITLRYLNHLPMRAKLSGGSKNISLLFEASGFLTLVSFLGSSSGNSVLGGVSSIIDSYDGMMIGFELQKQ